ncbi:MAG TPA: hypothetical protein VGT78_10325 [Rhizomicrobium sp.]|nr:hypothetical protein [Rhizomicrobium sp.]
MKRNLAIAIFSAALCFSPQAFATGMYQPDGVQPVDPQGEAQHQQQDVKLPPDPEGKAEELRLQGKCQQALPILRSLAADDRDDIAKFNLGQCLLDLSKGVANGQGLKREGVVWLLKAANKGLPNAQLSLVSVYLDGSGVPRDAIEAGKWSLIYHGNGMRFTIGMKDISPDLQARLDGALNEQSWIEARSRADAWMPQTQSAED